MCGNLLFIFMLFYVLKTSLVAQMVKRLSTMQETWVRSLGEEDPLEKKMAIHSIYLHIDISVIALFP